MIQVKHLIKEYGINRALDDVSFKINRGEIIGLLGPNGAGKTTTMKILTGYMPPSSGSVKVSGLDIMMDSLKIREKIGYLPESAPVYMDMTVKEYLLFAAGMHNVPVEKTDGSLRLVLSECGLTDRVDQNIGQLSKGYRQRVGLAQALISDPEILILDEPTVGLDPNQIIEIRELIKKIGQEKTVILSSHILAEVEATCDRVLIINEGKIVGTGTPAELRSSSAAEAKIIVKLEKAQGRDLPAVVGGIDGVLNVRSVKSTEPETSVFELDVEKGKDLRKEIVNYFHDNHIQLLELIRQELKLEDVFTQLTKKS